MIYFIQSGDCIKIGYSNNPEKRRAAIATASLDTCVLLLVLDGGYSEEKAFHEKFREYRIRGEWFSLSPDLDAFIKEKQTEIDETPGKRLAPMKNMPWQQRAKAAGLSQKTLAKILGVAENTVSMQLRGKWQSGTPRYVKFMIVAWEKFSPKQRRELLEFVEAEVARDKMMALPDEEEPAAD